MTQATSSPSEDRRNNSISVRLARDSEDWTKVVAIRAAVFLAEQNCPYAEEFDGNDFSATHVLGFWADEPAATMRIRYFADFCKPERLAIRHEFRRSEVARHMMEFVYDFCARKGYRQAYGHGQKRLMPFFTKFGNRPIGDPFSFSDFEYVPIMRDLEPPADVLSLASGHMVLTRPEGDWDEPGVLERSAERPVTSPGGK